MTGVDSNIVNNVASELATQMKRIPIIANVISETSLDRPELRIRPRAELAARLGVSTESLSQTIRVATIGDVGPALAKFDAGDRQVPIRVQLEDSARSDLQMLQQLRVPLGQRGERGGVPLSVVADIQLDQGPTSINRYDRERQATVAADLVGTAALGDATKMIYDLPVMKSLPKGVRVSPSGDAESLNELSEGFATAITAGLMMVYAVLVLLFGTFLQPITILFSLPLSIGGAIAALLLTGKQLTTPVWIGILMLMGIVTKNAIMLVEFAVEAIREGKTRDDAIIDAGMKRARPIVMTTIAMAAGMMPSALAFGAGGEFRSPMALAVIGGLIFSTILSLVFVPAMFMVMDDLGALIWRFGKKLLVSQRRARRRAKRSSQRAAGQGPARAAPPASVARGEVRLRDRGADKSETPADREGSRGSQVDGVRLARARCHAKDPRKGIKPHDCSSWSTSLSNRAVDQATAQELLVRSEVLCYSFRATAVSLVMFCSRMRPRCRSRMPSLRQSCSWRLTLSRAAPTKTPSCSCEMCTSEPKSEASAQSRRASRTGSGCSTDSSIRSLCQRMRWHSSMISLIATFGSRSRKARKSSRRSTNNSRRLAGGRVRGAALAVEHGDLAEEIAGAHEIQRQAAAVGGAGLDPDLAAADPEQRIAGIALLEQDLADARAAGCGKGRRCRCSSSAPEIGEHRVHFQNDRKFGLFAHCIAFQISPGQPPERLARIPYPRKCVISHISLQYGRNIFGFCEQHPVSGINSPDRLRPRVARRNRAVCAVWNVEMRALKIAGAAIAAVIVVIALLLVIGIPSGFLTSADRGAGRARDRLQARDQRRGQDRPVAVAQRHAERHRRCRTRRTATSTTASTARQHPGRRDAGERVGRPAADHRTRRSCARW